MPFPCCSHAVPMPCCSTKALDCLSHLIYTVRPCLIHTYHAVPLPFPYHATNILFWKWPLKAMAGSWQSRGRATAWEQNGNGMVCVNRPLTWHGNGKRTAWEWHGNGMVCVNRPLPYTVLCLRSCTQSVLICARTLYSSYLYIVRYGLCWDRNSDSF
jgi:hypothetical protein